MDTSAVLPASAANANCGISMWPPKPCRLCRIGRPQHQKDITHTHTLVARIRNIRGAASLGIKKIQHVSSCSHHLCHHVPKKKKKNRCYHVPSPCIKTHRSRGAAYRRLDFLPNRHHGRRRCCTGHVSTPSRSAESTQLNYWNRLSLLI